MIRFHTVIFQVAVIFVGQALGSATFAQVVNAPNGLATGLASNQLHLDVARLQEQIVYKRSQMIDVERFSAHGRFDPAYRRMALEITQLNDALVEKTQQVLTHHRELEQADLKSLLTAVVSQLTEVRDQLARREQAQVMNTSTWQKVEIEGREYYLVPVPAKPGSPTDPPLKPRRRPKVIETAPEAFQQEKPRIDAPKVEQSGARPQPRPSTTADASNTEYRRVLWVKGHEVIRPE